jgi:hypothetical protein
MSKFDAGGDDTTQLSVRAYHRILEPARTIADLAGGRGDQIIDNIWLEKKNHRHLSPKYIWQNHKSRAGYPKLFHFGVDVGATVSKLAGVT